MKRKGVIKPVGPCDMYRLPPTTSTEVCISKKLSFIIRRMPPFGGNQATSQL